MLTNAIVRSVFEEMSKESRLSIKLELHDYDYPFMASYEMLKDVIHVDVTMINHTDFSYRYDDLDEFDFTIEDYLKVILAHEFGHVDDKKEILSSISKETQWMTILKNAKTKEIRMELVAKLLNLYERLERNAWERGKRYIPIELLPFYDEINQQSLRDSIQKKKAELVHYGLN